MQELLERLLHDTFGGWDVHYKTLEGGASGRVFGVECQTDHGPRSVCIKLVADRLDPPFSEEPLEIRVYGGRPGNYDAARSALAGVISIPELFAGGRIDAARNDLGSPTSWRYWIMERLEGMSVVDWSIASRRDTAGLYHLIGRTLAQVHQLERSYPGWIDLPRADRWAWKPALFHTLRYAVARAAAGSELMSANQGEFYEFITQEQDRWRDLRQYSLSHPDGLQGLVKHDGVAWRFCGAVDIEDHLYTDPRFALAGIDLQARLRGTPSPEALREGYQSNRPWPPGYEDCRPVFQVLFLCTWTYVLGAEGRLPKLALELVREAARW